MPGKTIRQEVGAGKRTSFQIILSAAQFVRVIFEGEWAVFSVSLSAPSHHRIYEFNTRRFRPTPLTFITDFSGTYTLDIESREEEGEAAHCQLTIESVRRPAAGDGYLIAAERATAEAERLREEWQLKSLTQCIAKYKQAQTYWRRLDNRAEEASALKSIGDVYATLGQNPAALTSFNLALPLSKVAGDRQLEIDILNALSEVQADLGNWQAALDNARQALTLSNEVGFIRGKARALNAIGLVYHLLSDFQQALNTFDQAMNLWRISQDRRGQAQTLTNIAYSYGDPGDLQKSLSLFNEALLLWRKSKDLRGEAQTLTTIALLNSSLGEMQKAFDTHTQAIRLFRMMGDLAGEAVTLNGMAYIYETLGDRQRAVELFGRALKLFQVAGRRSSEAITLGLIGEVYYSLGDNQKALEYHTKKLNATRSLGDQRAEAYTLRDMGIVFDSLGNKDKALDYLSRALSLSKAVSDLRAQASTLNGLGSISERSGQREKALVFYQQALHLSRASEDRAQEAQTLHNIARAYRDLGNLAEAYEQAKALLDIVETQRVKVASRELQASYFASAHQHYELYIGILMRMHRQNPGSGYDTVAFGASERSRGRVLLDLLNEAQADIRQGVDPVLLLHERELQQLLNTKAERQMRLLSRSHTEEEATAIKKELVDITSRYEDVLAQIRATSPKYANLTQPHTMTLSEIQQILDADTMVLEYSLGEEQSYLWAVTSKWAKVFELPPRKKIEAAAIRLYRSLTGDAQSQSSKFPQQRSRALENEASQYGEAATDLTSMLLDPVAPYLAAKRLVIVADGALQYVPFAALCDPNNPKETRQEQPLVVNHEIVNLPSVSILSALRSETNGRSPAPKALAVFADPIFERNDPRVIMNEGRRRNNVNNKPGHIEVSRGQYQPRSDELLDEAKERLRFERLPFAASEAMTIASLIPEQQRKLALGFDATLFAAKSPDLQQYRILHFATHGLIYGEHPHLYGVVLSLVDKQGNPQDGFLRLNEIYNLKLTADLVVLSACQTALGKDIQGEGIVGLARGFMYAGVARVVASLWKVDDRASAELMKYFYEELFGRNQLRPVAALRAAQVRMLQQPRWKSPYYWAAFILQGEWK
ncbi:MAG TPA: CHAT domain-containing protein [Blastocatellia bacterium]|nr:CHAT domain-containing protein [Blastocatellia bacterium]